MCVSVPMTPSTLLSRSAMTSASASCDRELRPERHVIADGDEVDIPGDGVDLTHAVDVGDRLRDLGDAVDRGMDQDDGGDHGGQAIRRCG